MSRFARQRKRESRASQFPLREPADAVARMGVVIYAQAIASLPTAAPMVQQYLLPCECGKATPVTVAQAGRTLTCDCGRDQKVPNLAALRQLEPVETLPAKGNATQWSSTRGTLFVIGVLVTLAGLAAGGLGAYLIRHIDLKEVDQYFTKIEDDHVKEIDQMTPIQAYEVWEKIREMGPGVPLSAPEVQIHQFYQFWLRVCLIGFACAAIGMLIALSTLIGSRGKS